MQKYVSGFVIIAIAIAAALIFGPFGLSLDSDCRNTILREQPAPDGKHTAVLFERYCGATTEPSHQVSILAPGEVPKGGGNAFVSDDNHGAAPRRDGSYVALRWLSPTDLLIAYEARARTFKKADTVDGVAIVYNSARDGN
jgi:hypothetical protein